MTDEKNLLLELAAQEVAPHELELVKELLTLPPSEIPGELPTECVEEVPMVEPSVLEVKQTDVRGQLAAMSMAQKLKAAMTGNSIVRRLLVLDASRLIQECVLNNPKLGMNEIEDFARNPNMNAQALRGISSRSTWMRTYKVKLNLVLNPKCPADLSLRWLRFLHDADVKIIARSKNIPQVLQVAAKKKLSEKA